MIKILANDGIEAEAKSMLETAGFYVETAKVAQADLIKELPKYEVITVRSATQVRKELIDACPNLKVIARGGVGVDNIDVDYAKSKGINVITTPAASSRSVAELALAHILSLSRFVHNANRDMATGDFKKLKNYYATGIELKGKTIGIIGFGRIGQELAKLAMGMGLKVIYSDPILPEAQLEMDLYTTHDVRFSVKLHASSFDDILTLSDFISVHTPALKKPLIGAEELAKMKQGAIIINCARGGVIDEAALLDALNAGQIGGAGLDAFMNEPTPLPTLLNHARISVSPHIGASTNEAQKNIGKELAEKITAHFANK